MIGAPLDLVLKLIGAKERCSVALWAGKPPKRVNRSFAYVETNAGELWTAKIGRDRDPLLEHEFQALKAVRELTAGGVLAGSTPQKVRYAQPVLVQELLVGRCMHDWLLRARRRPWRSAVVRQRCFLAIDWLTAFHALGPGSRSLDRRGPTHGDFKPANVLLAPDRRLYVVDWELYRSDGIQIHDLFQFILYAGLLCFAPDRSTGFRRTVLERTWFSDIARACIARYLSLAGLPGQGLKDAFASYLRFALKRREALGLSNDGYFLAAAESVFNEPGHRPFALCLE